MERLIKELYDRRYSDAVPLEVTVTTSGDPIPVDELAHREFRSLKLNESWGQLWDSAWFRMKGRIPSSWDGKEFVALVDIGGEGCVFKDGSPWCGITYKRTDTMFERKRRIPLEERPGKEVQLLIEGAANGLFGENAPWNTPWPYFRLNQAQIAVFNRDVWNLALDLDFLLQLYRCLDPRTPRAKKILKGMNDVANLNPLTEHIPEALDMTGSLIKVPSAASELTAWSVGHGHLDLGWLWRFRETRRKGGRTLSTALRLMDEYPDYVFGASQPQLFEWIKEDYPELFNRMKTAVSDGRLECQGGMWVEPDMNLTGGESLVRQCLYGKKFFRDEFDKEINHLWLPDVFGYSASLPQILKQAEMEYFVTQKISWNETNEFPHHSFEWVGIDGSSVITHFLPTNDYNFNNEPRQLTDAALRFAQSDIHEGFLNLFGVGDGGGGPSRQHLEFARRARNCEGLPRVRLGAAGDFLEYLGSQDREALPRWKGELYLELHRGTYTTQAEMKKLNRQVEQALRDVELFGSLSLITGGKGLSRKSMDRIWKETLLHQFHDVLPGSSIREVYEDACGAARKTLVELQEMEEALLKELLPVEEAGCTTLVNTQSWERKEIVAIEGVEHAVCIPAMSAVLLTECVIQNQPEKPAGRDGESGILLANDRIQVRIGLDGAVESLIHKETGAEMFQPGGAKFLLYEDKPYSWDAWDISSYYRETVPEQAVLVSQCLKDGGDFSVQLEQEFSLSDSRIFQTLELRAGEEMVRSRCRVDWKEKEKMLRLSVSPALQAAEGSYEIQYGTVKRPTHSNTSWDAAKFEVCGHRFADLSQPDRGLALINDCKYGHRIQDGVMELTLLRSPGYPDPQADRGEQIFSYAWLPHTGTLEQSRVLQRAHDFNSPLKVVPGRKPEAKGVPRFTLDTEQVKIEVIKPGDSGNGLTLRLYETRGADCSCRFFSSVKTDTAAELNLLERKTGELPMDREGTLNLKFRPFEIKTIGLRY